ncbi:protein ALP1-like [Pararge aegeria]|nr:protein ALP1-like [Pararge aegeria]XP_039754706.1 protein ALP1-like [Pararge aegeria]XP_039755188.1 protein ALP1-like [Pararge aegeria]XP_039758411.1 protein ALP1-like [Pararge aegeria]XP_039759156.1 protein ALP1-like [Pararge aegeria]XP_039762710.1 protein ALP1-like [Pararge aegeria]XP_039763199.1 protein ALP1-like [Pararge aegeria]XP_039764824.1 protein ALP1-like [Pararge aegeria]XP_039765247.1 protein ALP1-like [Pararge aegeria]XP_039765356.1 protein ALP1-like [Pararge aegeria]XP_03
MRLLVFIILYYLWKKRQRRRRIQVHPYNATRLLRGAFSTSFADLREHSDKFFKHFRLSITTFNELLCKIEHNLKRSSLRRAPIEPVEKLAITLRFLATGNTYSDLHVTYRMGVTTISKIVKEVCCEIWEKLREECIPQPTTQMWQRISAEFEMYANFPNCCGAIDGKHIRIVNPAGGGSMFYNYKHFYSIVLLAMCDANYCFTYVNIGSCGKNSDSTIFQNSVLFQQLERNNLRLPAPKYLQGSNIVAPHIIIGDGAFGISNYVMKPYLRNDMSHKQKIFNYRLSRARRYIECTFGILSNKFRVFHTPMNVSFSNAKTIVKACCVLHNFIRVRDGYNGNDLLSISGLIDMNLQPVSRTGNTLREVFADYFISPAGSVSWQDRQIF